MLSYDFFGFLVPARDQRGCQVLPCIALLLKHEEDHCFSIEAKRRQSGRGETFLREKIRRTTAFGRATACVLSPVHQKVPIVS